MEKKNPTSQVNGKDVKYVDSSNTGLQFSTCFLLVSFLPDSKSVSSSTKNIYGMAYTNFAIPNIKQTSQNKHYEKTVEKHQRIY